MPSTTEMFPKKHLRAKDMKKGISYNLTIKACRQVSVFDFKSKRKVNKWALFFATTPKYLILNDTRGDQLTEIFGSNMSEDWVGHKVVVFAEEIIVAGKPTMTISITDSPAVTTVSSQPAETVETVETVETPPEETQAEARERISKQAKEQDKANREAAAAEKNAW